MELSKKKEAAPQKSIEYFGSVESKVLNIADIRLITQMISDHFEYRGFTFQRMTKDAKWYVCFANQIVNWGQYQNDLKEWVDKHYV